MDRLASTRSWQASADAQAYQTRLFSLSKHCLFTALVLFMSLVFCEAALDAAAWLFAGVRYQLSPPWNRVKIPDPVLGYRMSPFYPGMDARGYPNPRHVDRVDVLVLGDSMTYGFGASPNDSWPRQLARATGLVVYNAGIGGYGPCEYRAVSRELAGLHAHLVVVALFVGNDIADAYKSVYVEGRCSDLRSRDASTLAAIERADHQATLQQTARLYGEEVLVEETPTRFKNLALYGLLRVVKSRFDGPALNPFAVGKDNAFESSVAKPFRRSLREPSRFRTVFMDPRRDALAIDLGDVRLAEGLRILLETLGGMSRSIKEERRAQMLVAIIHNKPMVLDEVMRAADPDLAGDYAGLIRMETEATARITAWLDERKLPYVDTLDALRRVTRSGEMPYSESDDNHPNSAGYRAIADAVRQRVASDERAEVRRSVAPSASRAED